MEPSNASEHRATTRQLTAEDSDVHARNPRNAELHPLLVHRLGCSIDPRRSRRSRNLWRVYFIADALVTAVYGIELPVTGHIGRRLSLPTLRASCSSPGAASGDDGTVRHHVTLGAGSHERGGYPTVGNRVEIGPSAVVMGQITIGDDVKIGPGAIVVTDVPAGGCVLASAASVRLSSPDPLARAAVSRATAPRS